MDSPLTHFLDLLAREAPAVEFERPGLDARLAGAPVEALAALDRDKAVALRVRALLERRRAREAELSALFDTVADLATLRDTDAVLEAIVRRARKLLGTDVAYLTLTDPERGDTYMRVTDGSVSARFQRLRLSMGAGLGGLVAQLAAPYETANYPEDQRFRHTGEIDASVGEEGIVAILGVPLKLGPQVIGVLYAANRSARPFAREEVTLLSSLAAHAAVAIDNARLLAETRAALRELSAANTAVREHSDAVERAAEAHDRLADLILRGGDVEELARTVAGILRGPLAVLDADGRPLVAIGDFHPDDAVASREGARGGAADGAYAPHTGHVAATHRAHPADAAHTGPSARSGAGPGPGPRGDRGTAPDARPGPLDELGDVVARSRSLGRAVRDGGLWVSAVGTGTEGLCALVLRSAADLTEADQRIFERAAVVTALLLLSRRNAADAESRVRGELLDELISRPDPGSARDRARRLGLDLDRPHVVLVLAGTADARQRAASWAAAEAAAHGGLSGHRDGREVLLLPGDDPGNLARRAAHDLGAVLRTPVTAGAAGPVTGPAAVRGGYAEAHRCASALLALGRAGEGAGPADLGFVGLLLGSGRDVGSFVADTLGPVLDYDARRATLLVATLSAYFASGGSPARSAGVLHVHVNTVNQRLDRIGQLLGADWQQPERVLQIQLALQLHELRGSLE
ncbi:helix-turn-helix domain-containing protein [Longispora sp. K20-0274]|uniref:helix-turn-helix domain-containing protein n=1 Tax=Longispora sp. K20-0274 TaxID=3088255 RepID=UPI00399B30DC